MTFRYPAAVRSQVYFSRTRLAERPEGFTVGRLQEVADDVTRYYRDKGLILAQAFVPVQTVDEGIVHIQIMEGVLGRVVTEVGEHSLLCRDGSVRA